jgi:hypothetical protein
MIDQPSLLKYAPAKQPNGLRSYRHFPNVKFLITHNRSPNH